MLRQLIHFQEGEIHPVSRVLISIKQQRCSGLHLLQHGFLCWTRPLNTSSLLGTLADLTRGKSELVAENALLRQQLLMLRRQSKRPVCTKRDRSLLVLLARATRFWRQALLGWPHFRGVGELGSSSVLLLFIDHWATIAQR